MVARVASFAAFVEDPDISLKRLVVPRVAPRLELLVLELVELPGVALESVLLPLEEPVKPDVDVVLPLEEEELVELLVVELVVELELDPLPPPPPPNER